MMLLIDHPHMKPSAGTVNLLAAVWPLGQITPTDVPGNIRGRCRRCNGGCDTFFFTVGGGAYDYSFGAREGRELRLLQTVA